MYNLLMIGPPGSGKTMLAKRIATILTDSAAQLLVFEEFADFLSSHYTFTGTIENLVLFRLTS